ncbi:MAG TPA: FAD-binding protein, partial [Planococcus sp. (in: firmicutes)]|nr:FAD-binding protein [Planococcus sp. (in: firmicutes)]
GVLVSDGFGRRSVIRAQHVVLATGGIGQLYSQTSNSSVATGDGLSLAYHAGAVLEDLEFVQFHPTVLTLKGRSCGLVSEAVRGEGALLVDGNGRRIMEGIHPLLELAPRDVVARTIEWHWQRSGPVFLDARHLNDFDVRFPSIYENCRNYGIDPADSLMPVRPGAHFHMGGVKTDSWGTTSIPGLHAIGEVASTGVHGANRLASNSLLEGLVFGKRLAGRIQGEAQFLEPKAQLRPVYPQLEPLDNEHLKEKMTRFAGILRDPEELTKFLEEHPLQPYALQSYSNEEISRIHRATASSLIATAASMRKESRGVHYRVDFPSPREEWTGKVIELSSRGVCIRERKIQSKETVI